MKKSIITLAAAAFCALALTACGTTSLDPESYCTVDVQGANGYAEAELKPDYSAMALVFSSKAENAEDKLVSALYADLIKFEITSDKTENLENGDVIEIGVVYNKDALKQVGYSLTKDSFKYTVEGLEEIQELDAFKDLKISYTGYSPNAKIEIDSSGCEELIRQNIGFDYDKELRVGNGDTFTVKAICLNDQALLEAGYVMNTDTHQVTVSGVQEAVQVDPFEGLELDFMGVSPFVTINADASKCDSFIKNNVTFRTEKEQYANGEKAKVIVEYDPDTFSENGYALSVEEKEFDVDGMPYYLDSDEDVDFSEIDQDFLDDLTSKVASKYIKGEEITGQNLLPDVYSSDRFKINNIEIKPVKKMFLDAKDDSNKIKNNHLVIWEIIIDTEKTFISSGLHSVQDSYKIGDKVTIVFIGETYIQNVYVNEDGSLNTDNAEKTVKYYNTSYNGSREANKTADSVCEAWRTKNIGDYTISISDYE